MRDMSKIPGPGRRPIVVGYAHTPSGHSALRWAAREARRTGCELEVVHVFDVHRRADAALCGDHDDVRDESHRRAQSRVQAVLGGAAAAHRIRFTPMAGDMEAALACIARSADRLVLGEPSSPDDERLPARLSRRCSAVVTVVAENGTARELKGDRPAVARL